MDHQSTYKIPDHRNSRAIQFRLRTANTHLGHVEDSHIHNSFTSPMIRGKYVGLSVCLVTVTWYHPSFSTTWHCRTRGKWGAFSRTRWVKISFRWRIEDRRETGDEQTTCHASRRNFLHVIVNINRLLNVNVDIVFLTRHAISRGMSSFVSMCTLPYFLGLMIKKQPPAPC